MQNVPDQDEPDSDNDGVINGCDLCPNTIPALPVDSSGCPPAIVWADSDQDGDVDITDLAAFKNCASRSGVIAASHCLSNDRDGDNDVDLSDFARFQLCFSGLDQAATRAACGE